MAQLLGTVALAGAMPIPTKTVLLRQAVTQTVPNSAPLQRIPVPRGCTRVQAMVSMAAADMASAGANCHLTPDLVVGASCRVSPDLVEGASCDLVPDLVLGPSCRLTPADVGVEDVFVPTPVLPSGAMMAEFLVAYRRMLEHECGTGDNAAAAGENVLERIRAGLTGLLGHPQHGASAAAGSSWFKSESEVEACLGELEKDMDMFHHYHESQPAPLAVRLTSLHCDEAARLLRRL